MRNRITSLFWSLATLGLCAAGIAPYTYNPYVATYHAAVPAVYHHQQPVVYQQALPTKIIKENYVAPIVKTENEVHLHSHPQYDFSYGVHDSITGDIKSHVESRNGGNVAGSYSVIDSDGFKRTVTYTADDLNGFNAVVHREPILTKYGVAIDTPVVSHVSHVSPIQHTISTPIETLAHIPQAESLPIEYPEQQQQQQQHGVQESNFPPYHENENTVSSMAVNDDDSDVVELRSSSSERIKQNSENRQTSSIDPAPVVENAENETTSPK